MRVAAPLLAHDSCLCMQSWRPQGMAQEVWKLTGKERYESDRGEGPESPRLTEGGIWLHLKQMLQKGSF